MKRRALALLIVLVSSPLPGTAQKEKASPSASAKATDFDRVANAALATMEAKATELKVTGVAVVAYFEGETIQSWSSKMLVVGRYKDEPKVDNKGTNLLAAVYTKAAEMADTHQNSGSKVRPPMTGELGWEGGVIAHGKNGYIIAAFSGGKSEDDVQVSKAGLAKLAAEL